MSRPSLETCIGLTKWLIGMTMDEEPHDKIRAQLWKLVRKLRQVQGFRAEAPVTPIRRPKRK